MLLSAVKEMNSSVCAVSFDRLSVTEVSGVGVERGGTRGERVGVSGSLVISVGGGGISDALGVGSEGEVVVGVRGASLLVVLLIG